jgi:serine protease
VAAIRHVGSKVGFSSLGLEVTVAAPGGNCVNLNGGPCVYSLDTTSNFGTKAPTVNTFTDQINSNLGTSFSAPIVSGIAALMLSRNANLSSAQLIARLREGARPFPASVGEPSVPICHVPQNALDVQLAQCICTASTCGAGMANAAGSVAAAERPIVAIALPATVSEGQEVSLNASASAAACGRTVASFAWEIVSTGVDPPAVSGANTAIATVIAPASGTFKVRATVTDDQGLTDFADVTVRPSDVTTAAPASAGTAPCATPVTSGPTPVATPPNPNPSPTPTPTPTPRGGGGGGGSLGLMTLTLLAGLCLAGTRRRSVRISRCNCYVSRYICAVRH